MKKLVIALCILSLLTLSGATVQADSPKGYAWFYSGFATGSNTPIYKQMMANLGVRVEVDPGRQRLKDIISNPDNVFYSHHTHGNPGYFFTYGGETACISCNVIRQWMEDRPPFKFVFLISCHSVDEVGGDSLQAAFTKDFADPQSVVIGCPVDEGENFCFSRFFWLMAENPDVPLYDLYLDCTYETFEDLNSWEPCPFGFAAGVARFYGSHTTTARDIFSKDKPNFAWWLYEMFIRPFR